MDDLQFRRAVYADPNSKSPELIAAAAADPAKQAFWDDIKAMEAKLQRAATVSVPDGLAERLLLRQSMDRHAHQQRRNRWYLNLAASVAIVAGVGFTLWQSSTQAVDLGQHALAHVHHEWDSYAPRTGYQASLSDMNEDLSELGAQLVGNIGHVYTANYCNFDGIRSYHIVMEGEHGMVTVFVVPNEDTRRFVASFADQQLHGQGIQLGKASLFIVAEQSQQLADIANRVKRQLVFSA
ncbi:DUF3379 domain-containing protein [Aestuariibacter halophilus]|uniref:DUF3379 domain-containing protein n=1 Tax=Fluctibacter halophilus TaxID=226011 RepID=A0ABS8G645_9ALTE|nr:DUF3379 family protein [Aestuariibacter halophilus]MCC2615159.1 DUF3379 domain-containing protein [Aestuariibacter halophilus]